MRTRARTGTRRRRRWSAGRTWRRRGEGGDVDGDGEDEDDGEEGRWEAGGKRDLELGGKGRDKGRRGWLPSGKRRWKLRLSTFHLAASNSVLSQRRPQYCSPITPYIHPSTIILLPIPSSPLSTLRSRLNSPIRVAFHSLPTFLRARPSALRTSYRTLSASSYTRPHPLPSRSRGSIGRSASSMSSRSISQLPAHTQSHIKQLLPPKAMLLTYRTGILYNVAHASLCSNFTRPSRPSILRFWLCLDLRKTRHSNHAPHIIIINDITAVEHGHISQTERRMKRKHTTAPFQVCLLRFDVRRSVHRRSDSDAQTSGLPLFSSHHSIDCN